MTTAPTFPAPRISAPTRSSRSRFGDLPVAVLFLLPSALGFGVFYLWPTLRGFYLSLTDYSVFGGARFLGLDNFQRLLDDPVFWNSLRVTLQYVVINIGVQTVAALGIAVIMHRLTKSVTIRGIILLPYLIANVIVALVWFWMLDYQLGIFNQILEWTGIGRIAFLGSETWAIPSIALINVWRHMGYTALLLFAGLQMIPKQLYEAAAIDGSSEWRTFWRITLPLLRPIMALVLVLSVIGSFQIFDTIAVTTAGGPVNATRVIYFYIYELAFERFDFGYASAISVVLFLILAGVALAQLKMLRAGQSDLA